MSVALGNEPESQRKGGLLAGLGALSLALIAYLFLAGTIFRSTSWIDDTSGLRFRREHLLFGAPLSVVAGSFAGLASLAILYRSRDRLRKVLGWVGVAAFFVGLVLFVIVIDDPFHHSPKGEAEAAAIGALRTLTTAQALFREGDKDGDGVLDYATSRAELGAAKLIDQDLASGTKRRYNFVMTSRDPLRQWEATANPTFVIEPGEYFRYFFVDESGVIRFSTTGTATSHSTATGW